MIWNSDNKLAVRIECNEILLFSIIMATYGLILNVINKKTILWHFHIKNASILISS